MKKLEDGLKEKSFFINHLSAEEEAQKIAQLAKQAKEEGWDRDTYKEEFTTAIPYFHKNVLIFLKASEKRKAYVARLEELGFKNIILLPEPPKKSIYGAADFPIETLYPNELIYPGKINRGSLAFRTWRYKTPEHIPDEAFNSHYLSNEDALLSLAQKAGYSSSESITAKLSAPSTSTKALPLACQEQLSLAQKSGKLKAIPAEKYKIMPGYANLVELAKAKFSSVKGMLNSLNINPEFSAKKVSSIDTQRTQRVSHKYFVDGAGTAFLFTADEQSKLVSALGLDPSTTLSHQQLASLIFAEGRSKNTQLIGIGYFNVIESNGIRVIETDKDLPMMNTNILDFSKYFTNYIE